MRKRFVAVLALELMSFGIANTSEASDIDANLTVDNEFKLYISTDDCQLGTFVCGHDSWPDTTQCTIPLTPGVNNYIHIVGSDYGVIASVLGEFKLSTTDFKFSNDTQTLLTNTSDWQVYTDGFCATVGTLTDQGANDGANIWGPFPLIDPHARWIWTGGGYDLMTTRYFSAAVTPTAPASVEVSLDIKPQSCPNPINVASQGVLPVAILGTADFDVATIDLTSVRLLDVAPIRSAMEDVATPFYPFTGKKSKSDCTDEGADGFTDLTLKFNTQKIVRAIRATLGRDVKDGESLRLPIEGALSDGTPITGEDVVVILKKGKKKSSPSTAIAGGDTVVMLKKDNNKLVEHGVRTN